ncbi:MAG: hypothetical protein KTR30_21390 [Saprospiraceae bacterium]|nr:hypothetical protein [Saprospiraceae bacterium]
MSSLLKFFALLALLIVINHPIFSQSTKKQDWSLVKQDGETKVYTRSNKISKIKEVRIKTRMDVDFDHLLNLLTQVEDYDKWVFKSRNPAVLKEVGENEMYYFVESDFPFPLSDRDMIIHSKQSLDPVSKIYTSKSVAVPDYLPKKKKMVRMPMLESYWRVWPLEDGRVEIDYRAVADPGGKLPAWLINMAITQGPTKTMRNLEKLAKDTAPRPSSTVADK